MHFLFIPNLIYFPSFFEGNPLLQPIVLYFFFLIVFWVFCMMQKLDSVIHIGVLHPSLMKVLWACLNLPISLISYRIVQLYFVIPPLGSNVPLVFPLLYFYLFCFSWLFLWCSSSDVETLASSLDPSQTLPTWRCSKGILI